ncbi:unnamed protein product [Oppiella nova]|uniref:Uncharacterized protein n=1 Tax=Oppiella nova TaxID=334625 RepID=A0A7R9MSN2_9ACAR|nr:unnamed protein product [Oppiella nova]CAG2182142.1 unnamed protein product [Oppiella nova]
MTGRLGFLFIEIQYQSEAQRFKVVVRKAQNLYNKSISYSNFQITKPVLCNRKSVAKQRDSSV